MSESRFASVADQFELLKSGVVDLISEEELKKKLERSRSTDTPLTVKAGFDPSAPDLHLGHTVLLHKMRHFQDLGHRVVFVMGDFTGRIGDPTGRKASRPQLTAEDIESNLATYEAQVYTILDRETTTIERNSRWLDALGADGIVRLAARYTLARMMERDDFRTRFAENRPISIHELLYPLAQGYDSVALKADVELGGHDQIFNLLVGRDLMKEEGLEPQVVMTVPLLVGIDGTDKMSKSLGNAIGVADPPSEIYGRVMSIPDALLDDWSLLLTDLSETAIQAQRQRIDSGGLHPKSVKQALARELVTRFHDEGAAQEAESEFERVFSSGGAPDDMDVIRSTPNEPLFNLLADAGLAASKNESRRLIGQGAVSIDGERANDPFQQLPERDEPYVIKVGKRRFALIKVGAATLSQGPKRSGQ